MPPVLSVHQLTRSYGPVKAIRDLNFEVPEQSVFGILGPNGSGKTTLLATVMDVLKPDEGSVRWFGQVADASCRKKIGTLLETPNFYPYLSARDNLRLSARIKGYQPEEVERVLAVVGLASRSRDAFKTFSLGMKQRLAIGAALMGSPQVVVLDEPTNGLDPVGIADIRELIRGMGREGKTVIIASHLLDEVEKICTHVAILKTGALLASGPVSEVLARDEVLEVAAADPGKLREVLASHPAVRSLSAADQGMMLVTLTEPVEAAALNRYCFERDVILDHLVRRQKSLELAFLELTGPATANAVTAAKTNRP
jgi:ABC-2 type transport system ATP-binding protein